MTLFKVRRSYMRYLISPYLSYFDSDFTNMRIRQTLFRSLSSLLFVSPLLLLRPVSWHDPETGTYWANVAQAPQRLQTADPGPDYEAWAARLEVPLEALAIPLQVGSGPIEWYTVQPEDSLWEIAAKLDVHIADLVIANHIDDVEAISPGMELIVPRREVVDPENDLFSIYGMRTGGLLNGQHVVLRGETIERIAAMYGLSESTIVSANRLIGEVRPGQVLTLPTDRQQIIPEIGRLYWPLRDPEMYLSNRFKVRHLGIDLVSTVGVPVMAVADGRVIFTGWSEAGFGNLVIIDHGYGITTHYAHLEEILVAEGDKVDRENLIGRVGNSGNSVSPHLHFELRDGYRYLNPCHYLPGYCRPPFSNH